ncbi:hypothetical protein AB3X52_01390 [Nocardioides sp. DS6]|uniref:Sulfotransferase n=1 Tax=Nocardioides eburneus TaxID=3231482 RepID=A0ABV3SX32_9ACTN
MTDIYLHVGAHKTGSTYLQHCLYNSPAFFAAQDCTLVTHPDFPDGTPPPEVIDDIVQWRRNPLDVPAPESLARFLDHLKGLPTKSALWTYEGFLGEMNLSVTPALYGRAPGIVRSLGELLDGTPTKIAFTVRSFPDYIESSYKWVIRNNRSIRFERYLDSIDLDRLTWRPAVEALRNTFGDDNVLVTSYEAYRADSPAGNHQILRHFFGSDVDLSQFNNLDNVEHNRSPNAKALEFARLVHAALRRAEVMTLEDRRYVNKRLVGFINDTFTAELDPEPPLLMDADLKRELHARYVKECQELGISLTG